MSDFVGDHTTVDSGVNIGDGRILKRYALGSVCLPVIGKDDSVTKITFTNALYVPLLNIKLISERPLGSKKVFYSSEVFALYNRNSKSDADYIMALKELDGLPHLQLAEGYNKYRTNTIVMIASSTLDMTTAEMTTPNENMSFTPKALLNSQIPPTSTATAELKAYSFCYELAPHIPEDCMDCVSGRSLPESSTSEVAIVGRTRPRTVLRDGINRLVYLYIAQSLPVDRILSKWCPTSSRCSLSFHNTFFPTLSPSD
jgi:hypothetical protein